MKFIINGTWVGAVALLATVAPIAAQQRPGQGQGQAQPQAQPQGQSSGGSATKVAFVNTHEILRQAPGYAQAESTYNKELKAFRSEVQKLRASLDSAAGDFERQSAMLNATQRTAKRKALEEQQQKAEQQVQDLEQKVSTRQRELLEPIQSKITSVIEGIRAAGGYAIIFDVGAPNSGIVTADRSLDLTPRVIQQLKSGS